MPDSLNIPKYRPTLRRAVQTLFWTVVVAPGVIGIGALVNHRASDAYEFRAVTAPTFAPVTTHVPAIECDDFDGNGVACIDGHTGTEYVPRPTADPDNALDPGCMEDQAAVVGYDPDPSHGLTWICVTLDDWADRASLDRLDALTRERAGS